jgi:hypothetical protein
MSLADTRLLAMRCPAHRRRETSPRLSRGTWEGGPRHGCWQGCRWPEERAQAAEGCRDALSTVAGLADLLVVVLKLL